MGVGLYPGFSIFNSVLWLWPGNAAEDRYSEAVGSCTHAGNLDVARQGTGGKMRRGRKSRIGS